MTDSDEVTTRHPEDVRVPVPLTDTPEVSP